MNPYHRTTDSLPISRRTVIINTGMAAAAIAGLSSCTNYATAPESQPAATTGGTSGGSSGAGAPLGVKTTDIPIGNGKIFPDAQTVITQPKKGQFKAFSAICTHMGCLVNSITTTINCPCHGSKYSIADGSVVNPPAPQPLPAKTIEVKGDTLTVT
ncbi:MAG: Rieske (2Fe-2S) protein [Propionibacteriaceae bacterium]